MGFNLTLLGGAAGEGPAENIQTRGPFQTSCTRSGKEILFY